MKPTSIVRCCCCSASLREYRPSFLPRSSGRLMWLWHCAGGLRARSLGERATHARFNTSVGPEHASFTLVEL